VTMHKPKARIQRAEPDDDISPGGHVDDVLDGWVTQVQHRMYSVAPVRTRAVHIFASDVAVVLYRPSSGRRVDFWVIDAYYGEAVAVEVYGVVGLESRRRQVHEDQLDRAVVGQPEHMSAVAAVTTGRLGARPDVTGVILGRTQNTTVNYYLCP